MTEDDRGGMGGDVIIPGCEPRDATLRGGDGAGGPGGDVVIACGCGAELLRWMHHEEVGAWLRIGNEASALVASCACGRAYDVLAIIRMVERRHAEENN